METTLLYNPGVRTPYDRAAAFATLTCPFCGHTEPNEMLLSNNHWLKPPGHTGFDWCETNGMCVGQQLTTNHIAFDAKALRDRRPVWSRKFDEAAARKALADSIERGRKLGIDGQKVAAFYLATICPPCKAGEHERCQEETTYSVVADGMVDCACEVDHG